MTCRILVFKPIDAGDIPALVQQLVASEGVLTGDADDNDALTAWLKYYDPDGDYGRPLIEFTTDVDEAKTFPDFRAAFECWRQVSVTHPTRDDGKPNRPLTAYTIEIITTP